MIEEHSGDVDTIRQDTERLRAELVTLRDRRVALEHSVAELQRRVESIRTSRSWRALEAYRRLRIRTGLSGLSAVAARAAYRRHFPQTVPQAVARLPLGVNLAGYLDTESGMGEAARASVRSLDAAGIPVALNNVPGLLRAGDPSFQDRFVLSHPHPFNLVHLNADNMPAFAARRGRRYFKDRYTIGYWFWELDTLPPDWISFSGYVDEVWTATSFGRDTVRASCRVPACRMPLPVMLPAPPPLGRAHFGIPDRSLLFLYMFDVSSQLERKNPIAAIRAFRQAQLPRDAATLVLKFTNAGYDSAGVRRLHEEAEGLPVRMLEGYMDRPELAALLHTADCYLSPHRSEGFGLTILEAMSLGKPSIATMYSGNVDFMTPENSFPLDYTLVELTRRHGPYREGAHWAEPSIDHAARLIREVVANPERAAERGARARSDVERDWSAEATARAVRSRLETLHRSAGAPA